MTALLAGGLGAAALAAGLLLLRAACRRGPPGRGVRTLAGWGLGIAGFALWSLTAGADLALSLAALAASLIAYLVIAASTQVRPRRGRAAPERSAAEDPLARPRRPWRFAARIVLAGPLSLVFGVALCLALATRTPIAAVDAVVLAGLMAPLAFAGAMAWSLMDARLTRVAIGLSASSLTLLAACRL